MKYIIRFEHDYWVVYFQPNSASLYPLRRYRQRGKAIACVERINKRSYPVTVEHGPYEQNPARRSG